MYCSANANLLIMSIAHDAQSKPSKSCTNCKTRCDWSRLARISTQAPPPAFVTQRSVRVCVNGARLR